MVRGEVGGVHQSTFIQLALSGVRKHVDQKMLRSPSLGKHRGDDPSTCPFGRSPLGT